MLQPIVTPLSAPGSYAAAPLSRVKDHLGITGTAQDAELKRLILAVSMALAGIYGLRRDYWRRSRQVRLAGQGGQLLLLHEAWPLESVSSVLEGAGSSPTTVDPAEYSIVEPDRDALFRENGWLLSEARLPGRQAASADPLNYTVAVVSGWLMPDEAPDWTATTTFAAGAYARSSSPSLFLFQVSGGGGGNSGDTEPVWPTTLGATVDDGDLTWTAVAARRLPDDLEEAAIVTVEDWYGKSLSLPTGIQSEAHAGHEVLYDFVGLRATTNPLPSAARAIVAAYR